ncbi:MAG: aminoglycoside phosphotransferase, partial [Caulobacterales bacterium]|nr:aminoglycoside phosphotransferase [Caulobacterales bacterium]
MSSDREALKAAFLGANGFGDARREPLGGDASTRAYERLHQDGETYIFMDQPPALESAPCPPGATADERRAAGYNALARLAAGRVDAFIACALYLKGQGLSAPDILAADPGAGLAVLEDLGDDLFARLLETGKADEAELYDAAIDALLALHAKTPPAMLPPGWPLLKYDDLALETAQN